MTGYDRHDYHHDDRSAGPNDGGWQEEGAWDQPSADAGYAYDSYNQQGAYQDQGYADGYYEGQGYQQQGYQNQGYQNQGYEGQGYEPGYDQQQYQHGGGYNGYAEREPEFHLEFAPRSSRYRHDDRQDGRHDDGDEFDDDAPRWRSRPAGTVLVAIATAGVLALPIAVWMRWPTPPQETGHRPAVPAAVGQPSSAAPEVSNIPLGDPSATVPVVPTLNPTPGRTPSRTPSKTPSKTPTTPGQPTTTTAGPTPTATSTPTPTATTTPEPTP